SGIRGIGNTDGCHIYNVYNIHTSAKIENGTMTTLAKKMDTKNKQTDKRKSDETIIRVGTWNVRGIYGEGEIESLEREANKYSMELIALQETHISDTATTRVGEYMLFTSG